MPIGAVNGADIDLADVPFGGQGRAGGAEQLEGEQAGGSNGRGSLVASAGLARAAGKGWSCQLRPISANCARIWGMFQSARLPSEKLAASSSRLGLHARPQLVPCSSGRASKSSLLRKSQTVTDPRAACAANQASSALRATMQSSPFHSPPGSHPERRGRLVAS